MPIMLIKYHYRLNHAGVRSEIIFKYQFRIQENFNSKSLIDDQIFILIVYYDITYTSIG